MNKIKTYLQLVLLITLSAYVAADIGFLAANEFPVADDFFYSRQFPSKYEKDSKSSNIIIVTIDNQTMYKSGRLQYKRSVYASVLSKILEGHPKAIGVDIFFDGQRDIKDDLRFVNMLNTANGNIVLAIYKNEPDNFLLYSDNITSKGYFKGNESISIGNVQGIVENRTYGGVKTLLLTPRSDKYGNIYDCLPIVVLTKYFNADFQEFPRSDNDIATIGNISIPTLTDKHSDRYMYINYIGGLEAFNTVPFEQVPHMNPEFFKDKIVLIGVTEALMEDNHRTPISDNTPGIAIHANIIHTIINKRFISPVQPRYQWFCVFFASMAVFALFYYAKTHICVAAAILSLAAVKAAIDLLFSHYGLYARFLPFIVSSMCVSICALVFRKNNHQPHK
ncbi:MAG: CHASE2 domain-containing protein [Nitrospirae bacterium]|nr:CHASE2 domain-containing protein [Nitrospirota bacterium]